MDKKKIILFSTLGAGIIAGLVWSVQLTMDASKDANQTKHHVSLMKPSQHEKSKQPHSGAHIKKRKEETENHEENLNHSSNTEPLYEKPPEKDKASITQTKIKEYELEARKLFRQFQFLKGAELLKEAVDQYDLTTNKGEELKNLYFDASLLANVIPDEEATGGEMPEEEGIKAIFQHLHDPELALLGVLALPDDIRGEIILNKDSLNPIFSGDVLIYKVEEEKGEMRDQVLVLYPNIQRLYRIDFNIEGNNLIGYVLQYPDGRVAVHSIQEKVKGSTNYYTISEWEELYKRFNLKKSSSSGDKHY